MLQIIEMVAPKEKKSGEELYKENPTFRLTIKAPLYWWIDLDIPKYRFDMPFLDKCEFCFDAFTEEEQKHLKEQYDLYDMTCEQIMQILPLGAIVTSSIDMTYQEIVECCEEYGFGNYAYFFPYGFPNEREWKDFCETLLDITGVRNIVRKLLQEET